MIEKIKALKKFVNSIQVTELNEYKLLQERSKSYNEAIDDVVKLLAISDVSNSVATRNVSIRVQFSKAYKLYIPLVSFSFSCGGKLRKMINTEMALKEVIKLAENHLENINEEPDTETLNSMKNMIIGLNVGCMCDDYNGFDCGCSNRNWLIDEAIKEIDCALANES